MMGSTQRESGSEQIHHELRSFEIAKIHDPDFRTRCKVRFRATELTVVVLLSSREKFSEYYGGALARWTCEVYSRLGSHLDVTVFGYPTALQGYTLAHQATQLLAICRECLR
jgi:hypothetical protein